MTRKLNVNMGMTHLFQYIYDVSEISFCHSLHYVQKKRLQLLFQFGMSDTLKYRAFVRRLSDIHNVRKMLFKDKNMKSIVIF